METTELFAHRLRELREEKGLSQARLADELSVSRGSISYYENAERTPDIKVLAIIKEYFNVDFDYLLGYSSIRNINNQSNPISPQKIPGGAKIKMGKSIVYKEQRYVLDKEDAKIEFIRDLAESMDWPLYEHLRVLDEGKMCQFFFKRHILGVLAKINPSEDTELDSLRIYCRHFYQMLAHGTVFKALYYFRRPLYDKYLLRLSEKTVATCAGYVVKKFDEQHHAWFDYPYPCVRKGRLFFFKEKLEEVDRNSITLKAD